MMNNEDALDILTDGWTIIENNRYSNEDLYTAFYMATNALKAEKTAEWVKNGSYYQCSNCYEWTIEDDGSCQIRSRFCPNCGAKMKEQEEEE